MRSGRTASFYPGRTSQFRYYVREECETRTLSYGGFEKEPRRAATNFAVKSLVDKRRTRPVKIQTKYPPLDPSIAI